MAKAFIIQDVQLKSQVLLLPRPNKRPINLTMNWMSGSDALLYTEIA